MASVAVASGRERSALSAPKAFRPDIQGLRALAVLLVLVYHAGVPAFSGGYVGVDVFFVISGFLITGGLVRELVRARGISLVGFYSRRAARILPAATVTILGVLAITYLVLPVTRWTSTGWDALASSLYYVNWVFAGSSLDYLARDSAPSPLQHFWSLAVEEQYYIVWPVLLILAATVASALGKNRVSGRTLTAALLVVGIPSFAWSIWETNSNPGAAYFATTTRIWELALGSALAIWIAKRPGAVPGPVAAVVGWLGFVVIIASAVLFTSATPFPGFWAAVPTLGAVAVLWAGSQESRFGPGVLLSLRPATWVGGVSYSLYLWHWPLLVMAATLWSNLPLLANMVIAVFSFLPAWLSLRFIEQPFLAWSKKAREWDPIRVGGLLMTATVTASVVLIALTPPAPPLTSIQYRPSASSSEAESRPAFGAEVLFATPGADPIAGVAASVRPSPVNAVKDLPQGICLQAADATDPENCAIGDPSGTRTAVLIGDSHAAMFAPGLNVVASQRGWTLDTYTKGSCPLTSQPVMLDGREYSACQQWGDAVISAVVAQKPDLVIVATANYTPSNVASESQRLKDATFSDDLAVAWTRLTDAGIPVVAIRDAPRPGTLVPDCVAQNQNSPEACAFAREGSLPDDGPEVVASRKTGIPLIDLTSGICPTDTCPAVVGGALVYRDGNHLTATYSASLHDFIAQGMDSIGLMPAAS